MPVGVDNDESAASEPTAVAHRNASAPEAARAGMTGVARVVVGAASGVLAVSAAIGAMALWDEESWWVLLPAATFASAVVALVAFCVAAPSGRWSVPSLRLAGGAFAGRSRTRRRAAFGGALSLVLVGAVVGVRGILGQWDDPIVVGVLLLGGGGAVLEAIRRSARDRASVLLSQRTV